MPDLERTKEQEEDRKMQVSEGLLLVVKSNKPSGTIRFEHWTVKSVRTLKGGDVKATLIMGTESLSATATATFPQGEIRDPWRVVNLSQSDWEAVWHGRQKVRAAPKTTTELPNVDALT